MTDWQERIAATIQPVVARSKTLREIAIGSGVIASTGEVMRRHFGGDKVLVFCDEAAYAAAGTACVDALLSAGYKVKTRILPAKPRPKPSVELAATLEELLTGSDVIPVALGSGVMNDLVKHAAFKRDLPYAAIATAASMDGYASAGAPLSQRGFKITIPTRCPRVLVADLDIIAAAPAEMAGWGYGDLAGKVPAGGDWIIADALGIEAIDDTAWPLVQGNLRGWLANPDKLAAGDFEATANLFTGLTMVGLAMEFHGSSRPASGADHQIAHLWEMEDLTFRGERVSHGACVSVGCLTALALFDWLIGRDLTAIDIDTVVSSAQSLDDKFAEIDRLIPNPNIAERARVETEKKHLAPDAHCARLETLTRVWPRMRDRLESHLMRRDEVASLLQAAGAPVSARALGVTAEHHKATAHASRFIRDRYTVLDLLSETGLFNEAVETIFSDRRA